MDDVFCRGDILARAAPWGLGGRAPFPPRGVGVACRFDAWVKTVLRGFITSVRGVRLERVRGLATSVTPRVEAEALITTVLERGLKVELTDHLGYEKGCSTTSRTTLPDRC